MQKTTINPWTWQDSMGYSQAIEVKHVQGTLYCAGQAAMSADGVPSAGSMSEQILLSLQNMEQVIRKAGYDPTNIVRLNFYTTSIPEFFEAYGTAVGWMKGYDLAPASTLLQVQALAFPQLKVEIEATVVA